MTNEPTEEEKKLVGKLVRLKTDEDHNTSKAPVISISIQEELKCDSTLPRTWFGGRYAKPNGKTQAEALKFLPKQTTLLIVDVVTLHECEPLYAVVDNGTGSLYLINRDGFELVPDKEGKIHDKDW